VSDDPRQRRSVDARVLLREPGGSADDRRGTGEARRVDALSSGSDVAPVGDPIAEDRTDPGPGGGPQLRFVDRGRQDFGGLGGGPIPPAPFDLVEGPFAPQTHWWEGG